MLAIFFSIELIVFAVIKNIISLMFTSVTYTLIATYAFAIDSSRAGLWEATINFWKMTNERTVDD